MRRSIALLLVFFLALPTGSIRAAASLVVVRGNVAIEGRPLQGLDLSLLDLVTGEVYHAKTDPTGAYSLRVAPGEYWISAGAESGLTVGRGPTRLKVAASEGATANLDMVSVPTQTPTDQAPAAPTSAPATATTIDHEAIGCFIAGQFPMVDAKIEPATGVARARVYFKASGASNWFYVEMTPSEGGFVGKLPRPKMTASPISYYLQATTTDFGEARAPLADAIEARVVEQATDCESDKKIAPIGPPGDVTVFSAATGSAVAPAGFAAGGLALTAGTLALVLGGAVAAGVATVVVVTQPSTAPPVTTLPPPVTIPSPQPTPTPSPSPSPTPEPEPSPSPVSGSQ